MEITNGLLRDLYHKLRHWQKHDSYPAPYLDHYVGSGVDRYVYRFGDKVVKVHQRGSNVNASEHDTYCLVKKYKALDGVLLVPNIELRVVDLGHKRESFIISDFIEGRCIGEYVLKDVFRYSFGYKELLDSYRPDRDDIIDEIYEWIDFNIGRKCKFVLDDLHGDNIIVDYQDRFWLIDLGSEASLVGDLKVLDLNLASP